MAGPTFTGCPDAFEDERLHPKGAAAKPPPPSVLEICLQGALGHHLKIDPAPGQDRVSGGPLGAPQKRKYILECGKVSGVLTLPLFFYILHKQ